MLPQKSPCYVIESKMDKHQFKINQNIINASALLKNIYDLTEVTEPIVVDCGAHSLSVFIQLINNYHTVPKYRGKKFKGKIYRKFDNNQLAKLVQDLSILDSDIFANSVADIILGQIEACRRPPMTWKGIMELLGIEEDDFTVAEREMINEKQKEYFLSVDMEDMKFPFKNKSFYQLKTKFASPMNAFLVRIIQRASPEITFQISMINKTLKNEIDRSPLKLEEFSSIENRWIFNINGGYKFGIDVKMDDVEYANAVKKRKIQAEELSLRFESSRDASFLSDSLSFAIPNKDDAKAKITFYECPDQMSQFDLTKCSINYIRMEFQICRYGVIPFKSVYDYIMKDVSKEIELLINGSFGVFQSSGLTLFRKPNASKFHNMHIHYHHEMMLPFKDFLENYMETDGIIRSLCKIQKIPKEICSSIRGKFYYYDVSVVKTFLADVVLN